MFGLSRLWTAVIAAGVLLTAVGGAWLYVEHLRREAAEARAAEAAAKASEAVAEGQSAAAGDAAQITDAGIVRERVIERIRETNRETILQAPGADAPVDPELHRRLLIGLCLYAATRDPRCAEVRPADPGELPDTG